MCGEWSTLYSDMGDGPCEVVGGDMGGSSSSMSLKLWYVVSEFAKLRRLVSMALMLLIYMRLRKESSGVTISKLLYRTSHYL